MQKHTHKHISRGCFHDLLNDRTLRKSCDPKIMPSGIMNNIINPKVFKDQFKELAM